MLSEPGQNIFLVKMKSYREDLWFEVPTGKNSINITPQMEECLLEELITDGLILCKIRRCHSHT